MIPISPDVRTLIGDWAEGVDNRSLLHEKFALPKVWDVRDGGKLNDAGRWSVLRIVTRGSDLLQGDAQRLRREAGGRNVQPHVAKRKESEAHIAEKMANVAKVDLVLAKVGNDNARRFLAAAESSFPGLVATFEATLGARMMINMAGGVVENAGIAMDRCFGLPLIPGSAVKGIARVQALWEIHEAKGDEKTRLLRLAMLLFGYGAHDIAEKGDFGWAGGARQAIAVADEIGAQEFKGCACFLPAYPTTPPTLVVDMVNPHYPDYYRGKKPRAEDDENPIPNYFPAVEAGSSFGFGALLNRVPELSGITAAQLLEQLKQWLQRAITRKGVGAKTAAGYGWFELGRKQSTQPFAPSTVAPEAQPSVPLSPADAVIAKWRGKLATTGNFIAAFPEMLALTEDDDLKRVFEEVIPDNERRRNRKGNPYWQSFTSGKHGEYGKKILARLKFNLT